MSEVAEAEAPVVEAPNDGKIVCKIDNARVHSIQHHISQNHPTWTIERYKAEFPKEPLLSSAAEKMIRDKTAARKRAQENAALDTTRERRAMADVFDLGSAPAALNARKEPIMVTTFKNLSPVDETFLPDIDPNYIFDIEALKDILIGLELNIPTLCWGMHGTGKTSLFEQICARISKPWSRVQHTINTEESHIVGQYIVKDGATEFQLGPLPVAMMNGYAYCADEYDFALPSVLAVYQPVLEGKALVIKDAPPELRVIRPHPNFRFYATGNTNGGGDETGLYQGTQIQNAANYSRFGITIEMNYMEPKIEAAVIASQARIEMKDAERLVAFAKEVREMFRGGKITTTISPRELIYAARLGNVRASDWRRGLKGAFINRLNRTDREVVDNYAQRLFG